MTHPPDPIRILAPHSARRDILDQVTRRRALALAASGAMAAWVSACGGSSGTSGGSGGGNAEEETPATTLGADAKVEAGPLLLANWVDYTDPENYKKYTASVGPKVTVDGYGSNDELLAKLSAGGRSSTWSPRRVTRSRR
jgi:spermidine/putrescine transport system substrate-binding protein